MSATSFTRNANFFGLLVANTILGAAMPMLIILGGLAGLMLAPSMALATIPASLQTLAGLLAAAPFSLVMGRLGRKAGFMIGGGFAIAGALVGTWALLAGSFALLCLGHMALGAALACYQYFRFAAAEVVSVEWQPVAISLMLTSGLVAAFAGPQIFIIAKDGFAPVPLAGAYASIAGITVVGLGVLAFVRMPKAVAVQPQSLSERLAALSILKQGDVRRAVGIGAVSMGTMVFLMVPTPLAMIGCGLSEAAAGDVIRWHVVAMFAPSFFTGFLIKRFGTQRIAMTGLALLVVSGVIAAIGLSVQHFYLSLIVLGVGWNFGFIGATTMLAAVVPEAQKAVVQGANDTVIALASTLCAFAAGAIVAGFGWTLLAGLAVIVVLGSMLGFGWTGRRAA
ncbi:MFS transporter [uncultured Sulfitobacter sp.]|uniref:MFS transporter n=1 Tax=uncultured Sulfitobacter sp. TaxID=191468 RepID=UPI00260ACC13|nr:MFS transporter [uncultured Sulfitobacter sp.]